MVPNKIKEYPICSFIMKNIDRNNFPIDSNKAILGTFYHGINLNSEYAWYARENLKLSNMFQTPDYIAYWDEEYALKHTSITEVPIDALVSGKGHVGGLTPLSGQFIVISRAIRNGEKIYRGLGRRRRKLRRKEKRDILERSNIELKFEEVRRKIAQDKASRLSSIFVADNEDMIRRMFENNLELLILKVNIIEALKCSKVDVKWYEEYWNTKDEKCIENYWKSYPYDPDSNNWEYLVDGLVVFNESPNLDYIRTYREADKYKMTH